MILRTLAITIGLAATLAQTAIGDEQKMTADYGVAHDAPLRTKIETFGQTAQTGARLELASLTDFPWDKVIPVQSSAPLELYAKLTGSSDWLTAERGQAVSDESVMLVFMDQDRVVAAPVIAPPIWIMGADPVPHGREAALVVTSPGPGSYAHLTLE